MKREDFEDFKQTFKVDFPEIQLPQQRSRKTKYIKLGIALTVIAAIITTVVLLVGHYKYGLFQSELYQVTNIKRELYSEEYYTETKTIKSKLSYTSGELDEIVQKIEKNFVVMITDKEELPNKVVLNTATLVVLNSKIELEGKQSPLNGFNIFDEKAVEEFKKNPTGEKYPMAVFHFYENGTIKDVNFPKEMDKENIENLYELINNVMPKLVRNKTEDEEKGIEIKTRTDKKKKTLSSKYKVIPITYIVPNGSTKKNKTTAEPKVVSCTVERDIEDEKITEIRAKTNLYFETEKEETDYIDFGIKDFYYDTSSVIVATENKENKVDDVNLVKDLVSKMDFVETGKLLNSILDKEEEELKKKAKEAEEESPVSEHQLRNLGWSGSFGWDWTIANSNILGQKVSVVYSISLSGGKVKNSLSLKFNSFSVPLGNTGGASSDTGNKKSNSNEQEVGKIPLGTFGVTLSVKVGGSLNYDVCFKNNVFTIKLGGSVYAKAGIVFGWEKVASFDIGVKGTLISATFSTSIQKNTNGSYSKKSISLTASAGAVSVYAQLKFLDLTLFNKSYEVWKGWPVVTKTW